MNYHGLELVFSMAGFFLLTFIVGAIAKFLLWLEDYESFAHAIEAHHGIK
jgi:hypothetical protein